jgi:hypothetical protein
LVGILIGEFFKNKISFKRGKFLLILIGSFIVHMVFDAFSIFVPISLFLKVDIIVDVIIILISIVMFYLLWRILNKSLKYAAIFFIIVGIGIDILAEIYLEILILEIIHFILMFGIFISFYFLTVKFLINGFGDKR